MNENILEELKKQQKELNERIQKSKEYEVDKALKDFMDIILNKEITEGTRDIIKGVFVVQIMNIFN